MSRCLSSLSVSRGRDRNQLRAIPDGPSGHVLFALYRRDRDRRHKADNPIAKNADVCLLAPSDMTSFVDSLVAPLSVINALIAAIGYKRQDTVSQTLEKLERIWDEYEVYDKSDLTNG